MPDPLTGENPGEHLADDVRLNHLLAGDEGAAVGRVMGAAVGVEPEHAPAAAAAVRDPLPIPAREITLDTAAAVRRRPAEPGGLNPQDVLVVRVAKVSGADS